MLEIINKDFVSELPFTKNENGYYQIIPRTRSYSAIDKTNKQKFPNGFIYFINIKGTNYYKLGVSQNIKRRLYDISSSMPFDLDILSIHYFNDVYDIESNYKIKLFEFIQKGEWMKINDISIVKDTMIELHNLESIRNGKK
jgi:hypothetical protein